MEVHLYFPNYVPLKKIIAVKISTFFSDQSGININDISGFCVPMWMIEKMRHQMMAMRTDLPKVPKHRSRSVTPNEGSAQLQEVGHLKDLN